MYLIRNAQTGWVSCYAEESQDAAPPEVPEGYERVDLDISHDEFEVTAREDAGLTADEPLGEVYVEDEPIGQAFGSPGSKSGKRICGKRVKAYAPDTRSEAAKLANELGRRPEQAVRFSDIEEILRRMDRG